MERVDNGYLIVGWSKWNKSTAEATEQQERRRLASAQANHQRWHVDTGKSDQANCSFCRSETETETESESESGDLSASDSESDSESDRNDKRTVEPQKRRPTDRSADAIDVAYREAQAIGL
jgi:hypothetical protein